MAYHQIAQVFLGGTLTGLSDRQVLDRYVDQADEAAFETLLARHGPMVLTVCRQLLHDPHDIDDAFQATFLALIRKAGSIRVEESLGPWLHTVAGRIAIRARAKRLSREVREPNQETLPEPLADDRAACPETSRILHEELARLPARLRAPIVLCYLESSTHEMAASQLGCPVGTVRSRLARARVVLHRRLVRRGLTLSVGGLATMLETTSRAATVPFELRKSLLVVATRLISASAAGSGIGLGVSAPVVELLEGALNVMRIKTLTIAAATLAALGISMTVVGLTGLSLAGPPDEQQPSVVARVDDRPDPPLNQKKVPEVATFPRTYGVGDLVSFYEPQRLDKSEPSRPPAKVNMIPLMKLIATTIDPGSWKIFDDEGRDISASVLRKGQKLEQGAAKPIGSMTPFYLSISIIVRATDETHEKVATLLRGMRALADSRQGPGVILEEDEERFVVSEPQSNKRPDPQVSTSAAVLPEPKSAGTRARIEQLMEQLRQEIAKLP